ncbi:MAG: hypothetical protein LBN71_07635, partial [Tannerella sp.]|nr:hypothetical protein [Tannerella sp.]
IYTPPLYIVENIQFDFPHDLKARKLYVATPQGYAANPDKRYPVIYLNGIRQRYHNGGADNDGDDFFAAYSWDLSPAVNSMDSEGKEPGIVVAFYGYISEFSPWENEDFMGSGKGDQYLDILVNEIMPYINGKYRTLTDAGHTTIAGADLGGPISYYAALKYPDVFGKAALFSPSFWFNKTELLDYAGSWNKTAGQKMYFAVGSKEGDRMQEDTRLFYELTKSKGFENNELAFEIIEDGRHDDVSWGKQFNRVYSWLLDENAQPVSAAKKAENNSVKVNHAEWEDTEYRFMDSETTTVVCHADEALENTVYFPKNANDSKVAKVYIKEVPVSVKGSYYWNLNIGSDCTGENFFASNKNVGFSSAKQYVSWLRVVVYDDLTSENVAASSAYFRVVKGDATPDVTMIPTSGADKTYTVSAEVDFPGNYKSFEIYFGSVNSGSKQSALTQSVSVSETCIKAQIIYYFKTNKVEIIEKGWSGTVNPDAPAVVSFSATPSVCKAGAPVTITSSVETMTGYSLSYGIKHNYGSQSVYPATPNAQGEYEYTINAAVQGIYHIQLIANNGSGNLSGMPLICVKVPYSNSYEEKIQTISANAYQNVNWNTTGRYKGNFHTHTSQSFDDEMLCQEVIDRYHSKDYRILALTDHDVNTFPWNMLDAFDENLENRDPVQMGMLSFTGVELSKDSRNNWSESTGGEFNHHNDFFTGRKGQEFMSLQESYAYTQKLGGLQIINHPGQYWKPETTYDNAHWEKNSPAWHARNFTTYESLIGLEVYNQGDKWTSDRVLWDQILSITMPGRPVYGYSNDDSHNVSQYFRNYQFMLMSDFSIPALKEAMRKGQTYFSYEPGGSGEAKAPLINSITIDDENETVTIDTPDRAVYWIAGTDKNPSAGNASSTVVGYGKTFNFSGFQGNYIRAMIKNQYGETCTQPFGFTPKLPT